MTPQTPPLKAALGLTPECIPFERFVETLDAREQAHIEACARCQSEYALWREFDTSPPVEGEGAAVQWIVAELGRRRPGSAHLASPRRWRAAPLRPWAAGLAATIAIVTVAYFAWDREPAIHQTTGQQATYRSGQVQALSPLGDVRSAPSVFEWMPFDRAASYEIEVFEVDRTSLLRATSSVPRFELPPTLIQQLAPGKTILWEVRARNSANQVIGESGAQRVHVLVPGSGSKD